jgi:hypothetical protein
MFSYKLKSFSKLDFFHENFFHVHFVHVASNQNCGFSCISFTFRKTIGAPIIKMKYIYKIEVAFDHFQAHDLA